MSKLAQVVRFHNYCCSIIIAIIIIKIITTIYMAP